MATIVTDTVQRPTQLDYKLRAVVAPKYKFMRIPLNNLPSATADIGAASAVTLEWKLPTRVYNLARSYISYQLSVAATANKSSWTHEDVFDLGNAVTFGAAGGVDLVNLQYAQNYTKIARKIATEVNDFIGNDDMSGLYRSNKAVDKNKIPGGYNRIGGLITNGTDVYIEPCYSVASAAGAPHNRYRQYPLSAFVGTLLAVDRDFYSPVEQYLRVQAGWGDKMAFTATDDADPVAGVHLH